MITIEPIHLVYLAIYVLASGVLTAVGVVLTLRARVDGVRAQVRSAMYVFAYDDALQWIGVSGKERMRLYGELRANIAAAAADAPVTEVLRRMGPPREMARAVAAGPSRPRWVLGMIAGAVAALIYAWAVIVGLDLVARTIEAAAAPGSTVDVSSVILPGLHYEATTKAKDGATALDAIAVTMGPGIVVFPILVGLVAARPWRAISRSRAARTSA